MKKLFLVLLFVPLVSFGQKINEDIQWIINKYNNFQPIDKDYGSTIIDLVYVRENKFYYKFIVKDCEALKRTKKNIRFFEIMANAYLSMVNDAAQPDQSKWEIKTIGENYDYLINEYSCEDGSNGFELRYKFIYGQLFLDSDLKDLIKL